MKFIQLQESTKYNMILVKFYATNRYAILNLLDNYLLNQNLRRLIINVKWFSS